MRVLAYMVFLCLGLIALQVEAQNVPIGQWKNHISYQSATCIAQGRGKIYCGTHGGLYSFDVNSNSLETISKINGLNGVGITALNYDSITNTLVVAYDDANVDIIQNGTITNLPDIKIQPITGNKSINAIYFQSPLAYLACGFGIVVVDITKFQTNETYYIGPAGKAINVRDITSDGQHLIAGTDNGVYMANLNAPNLNDFNAWTSLPGLPSANGAGLTVINALAYYNDTLVANYSAALTNGTWQQDVLYKFNGAKWKATSIKGDNYKRLKIFNNNLIAIGEYQLYQIGPNLQPIPNAPNYNNYNWAGAIMADAIISPNKVGWIADKRFGLVRAYPAGGADDLLPNAPRTNSVFSMAYSNGTIYSVPGGLQTYNTDGFSRLTSNGQWSTTYGQQSNPSFSMDSLHDLICVVGDPFQPGHAYAGSDEHGLLEFNNGTLVNVYNNTNTGNALRIQQNVNNYYRVEATGVDMDSLGNLWVANGETVSPVVVKQPNGQWRALNFSSLVSKPYTTQLLYAKQAGQVWTVLNKANNLLVYNSNAAYTSGTSSGNNVVFPTPNASNAKVLTANPGSGNLPGSIVNCIAEDKNGSIWVGTDVGVTVFYNPTAIFSGGNFDAQQPILQQGGYNQYLMQGINVTSIAVDGANRKWIGTSTTGAYLISADGTSQLYNVTATNSPLLSNNVITIAIQGKTGDVFFGTDKGTVSFRGTATSGDNDFHGVYCFPNPVKHDYAGTIAVAGLTDNCDVKITTVDGTLVYHTIALGGQAIWNGNNFNGEKVNTGIYLVFCTSADGSKSEVTKLLVVH